MRLTLAAVVTLFIAGCMAGEDPPPESAEVRTEVRAILSAPTGPDGADEEYEVYVSHTGLPPEAVDALIRNVRIRPLTVNYEAMETDLNGVRAADLHWVDPALHDFHVRVRRMMPKVDPDVLEWFWADHAVIDVHCPPGH